MKDYKQYNYPNVIYAGEAFPASACGPCSVADLVEKEPTEIATWMTAHGYAENGHGTIWGGINDCLKAYGGGGKLIATGLLGKTSASQFSAWKNSVKDGNKAILLMGAGVNSYWTRSGHYIAVQQYDPNTDKYYVTDPASAARTGWHSFSEFAGNIKNLYTSTIRWEEKDMVADKLQTLKITKRMDGVTRYVAVPETWQMKVHVAPYSDAPLLSPWGYLNRGDGVQVLAKTEDNWALVSIADTQVGWVGAKYLSTKPVK